MTYACPLLPVSVAVYRVLQDAAFAALCPGGVFDSVPQAPSYPFLLYEVTETQQRGGLGTKPGVGTLPEIEIRLHVYSTAGGFRECQQILGKAIALLADPPTVSGYASWAIFHDQTIPLPDEQIIGVTVQELVALLRLYVQEN